MRRLSFRLLTTRPARAAAVAFAATAVIAGALTAPPAMAATPAPRVTAIGGDGLLTAAWSAVAGASRYVVKIASTKSLKHARTITTTSRTLKVHGKNGHTYYVAVTPALPGATRSKTISAVLHRGVPIPVGRVTASPGPAEHQVTVKWTGGGKASKVAVVAGSNVITNERSFHSGWYPATTRSITITVPVKYRAYLGAGTGTPVFVKVVQSNSTSTSFGPSYSYDRKYRPSPTGTWSFARAIVPTVPVSKLKVAQLNIQNVGVTTAFAPTNRWAARAPRVVKYVESASPDILTTSELSTGVLDGCRNTNVDPYGCASHTQYMDFAHRVKGLKLADEDAYARVLDQGRTYPKQWSEWVTAGAHVFYNPDTLKRLDWGYFSPGLPPGTYFTGGRVQGLGVTNWVGHNAIGADRWISWAKLETKDSDRRQFYVVAAHLPVGDAAIINRARYEEVQKLIPAIDRLAGNLPVVFGSDMNRDSVRQVLPGQPLFIKDGWFDAGAVAKKSLRTNMRTSTTNGSGPQIEAKNAGYGARPYLHPYVTSRIDYILLRNSPHTYRYDNVLRLHPDGTFDKSMQGTDHNMQLATIGIASPQ